MRVIVFSDSHGQIDYARKVLKGAGQVDLILHAGDFYRDALALADEFSLPVKAVQGNCDGEAGGPEEELFDLAGHRVLMTHGHLNGIDRMGNLLKKAREYEAEAVIFGHTHMPQSVKMDGILFFNPGSISRPRDQDRPSYGILEIGEGGIVPSIVHY
ncbi:metallophosphoesterase family protein [Pelotomaculum propionicicum]|uniref:metallophosphoesterase family protein n=1 Tax=Pelotomaculum propionicicum TaxID=258475 RepID=UPI003B760271